MPEMKVEIQPWTVPDSVFGQMPPGLRQDGIKYAPVWKLSEVDANVLAELCDQFRTDVFKKAGKPDPATVGSRGDGLHDPKDCVSGFLGCQGCR